jgi:hypothetical protein
MRIVREIEAADRLCCKRSKFRRDYLLRDLRDPYIPNTQNKIKRLRPIRLGKRNFGLLEHELDAVIRAIAALPPPPTLERNRAELEARSAKSVAKRRERKLAAERRLRKHAAPTAAAADALTT